MRRFFGVDKKGEETMKKRGMFALCLCCLCLLSACRFLPQGFDIGLPDKTVPEEAPAPDAASPDAPVRTAEDYVVLARSYEGDYTDSVGNEMHYHYRLPLFSGTSEDVRAINASINQTFGTMIDEELSGMQNGYSLLCYHIDFSLSLNGDLLSLLIVADNDWGMTQYGPYIMDVSTGRAATFEQILASAGFSEASYNEAARRCAQQAFYEFAGREENVPEEMRDFYNMQYEATLTNNDFRTVYLDESGALYMVIDVYSLAGADCYSHCVRVDR